MRRRCNNPNHEKYPEYGGRGIRVCDRWKSFRKFLADVGPRPSPNHTLNRKKTDGHYEPGNVEWADNITQQRNRRNNRIVTIGGESMTVAEAAERFKVPYDRLRTRLDRGWTVEEAVSQPRSSVGRKPKAKRTDAENAALIASVDAYIRKLVRDSGCRESDRDDLEQNARLALWKVAGKYDPAKAKFITFAGRVVCQTIAEWNSKRRQQIMPAFGELNDGKRRGEQADNSSADAAGDVGNSVVEAAACDVEFAAKRADGFMAGFSESQIRMFRLIAVDGLTVDQVAEQLGQEVKIVEINLRSLVKTMIDRGQVPAELVAKFQDWKRVNGPDGLNPVRRPAKKTTYAAMKRSRKGRKDSTIAATAEGTPTERVEGVELAAAT